MPDPRRAALLLTLLVLLVLPALAGCYYSADDDDEGDDRSSSSSSTIFPQSIASGDPRPDSIVLWTRVVDPDESGDLDVTLILAEDQAFQNVVSESSLTAEEAYDGCVKTRVTGLMPGTTYWYRFRYRTSAGDVTSHLGRTRTAPDPDADVPVRWAFFSCQDYVGRWYNAYVHLLQTYLDSGADLDFLVFLGDYVYETTGDPSFQSPSSDREFSFEDTAGALELGEDDDLYYAAKSLANYRTLYKTYRSDPWLQRLHEQYPMIAVWDDHEFSDDSHGATSTDFDGKVDETDPQRRKDAERAFFESMPIEVGLGADDTLDITDAILYPNTRVYDRFRFGANCEIFLTDSRTYRPDHTIPENGFPGRIVMDESATEAFLGAGNGVEPYVDMDAPENAALAAAFAQIATVAYLAENPDLPPTEAAILASEAITGKQAARYVNEAFAAAQQPEPFDETALEAMPKGIAYLTLGKQSIYAAAGSRYVLDQDLLAVYDAYLRGLDPAANALLGLDQTAWLEEGLTSSTATWKVIGSSVSFTPMVLDFTSPLLQQSLPEDFPEELKVRLQLNADQWDGFPGNKQELLTFFSRIPGAVLMSGDIHSSWLADHGDRSALDTLATHRVFEFTGVAVSSGTFESFIENQVGSLPLLDGVDVGALLAALGPLFMFSSQTAVVSQPSEVLFSELASNGYVVMEAAGDALRGTYHHYPEEDVFRSYYGDVPDLMALFTDVTYEIRDGDVDELP